MRYLIHHCRSDYKKVIYCSASAEETIKASTELITEHPIFTFNPV